MNARDAANQLIVQHQLSTDAAQRLLALAAPSANALQFRVLFWRVITILAAALFGFGIVMWVAANWEDFGRFGRFGLLFAALASMGGAAAALLVRARANPQVGVAFGLLTMLIVGALFAYFGQTYQTGADPWQLFAVWAALTLPMCLAFRSDVLWTLWTLIATLGIQLWVQATQFRSWNLDGAVDHFAPTLSAWALAAALALAMSPLARAFTGAGRWSFRLAMLMLALLITGTGMMSNFSRGFSPITLIGIAIVALGAWALSQRKHYDVFGLSAFTLCALALTYSLLVNALLRNGFFKGDIIGFLLLAGLAAYLLSLAVKWILKCHRAFGEDLQ